MRPTEAHLNESSPLASIRTIPQKGQSRPLVRRTGRNAPTTFFMRTEEEVNQIAAATAPRHQVDSTFGIQSLGSTHEKEAGGSQEDIESAYELGDNMTLEPRIWERRDSGYEYTYAETSPILSPNAQRSPTMFTTPLAPLYLRSPVAGSGANSGAPSTPKSLSIRSLRLSDDDSGAEDSASQAITSSGEEDDDVEEKVQDYNTPQLVMPSLSMPSRRPFTDRGKNIGKLKIMVAGPKGCGKSSLIKSMVQVSEDIVHLDTAVNSLMLLGGLEGRSSSHRTSLTLPSDTHSISEIHASTRAYPPWWAELDESRILRRRRSTNDIVLERNICFIDTPGICDDLISQSQMDSVAEYAENLLWRSQSFATFSDGEVLGVLSGSGGIHVDLIIFVLSGIPRSVDLEFMARLSRITNLMPVISKADLLPTDELTTLRITLLENLQSQDIRPFLFGNTISDLLAQAHLESLTVPCAISSAPAPDHDTMDASLLMSSHYIQPLTSSDLTTLTTRLFDPDTTAHLRHTSARKFLHWRRTRSPTPTRGLPPPASVPVASINAIASTSVSPLESYSALLIAAQPPTPSPFQLARLADHTTREERLTQVHLARWAADLQRSMQNERERYTRLQCEERRSWLAERMSECVDEELANTGLLQHGGKPVPSPSPSAAAAPPQPRPTSRRNPAWSDKADTHGVGTTVGMDARDPLGFLEWDERIRRRGVAVVKVLGGCGVAGALAIWVLRSLGVVGCGIGFGFGGLGWGHVWSAGFWGSSE